MTNGAFRRLDGADLTITGTGTDTVIAFDAADSVTLVGVSDPTVLQASDFIFA